MLLTACLFFSHVSLSQAQTNSNGSVSGTVKTSDGRPAEFVNVALKGTTRGTAVNAKGNYSIKNITPGHYTLVASWSQELTTAADGTVTFKPEWPGKYVVEAEEYTEAAGEHNGNAYKALWQGATYSFEVVK